MEVRLPRTPPPLAPILPPALRKWAEPIEPAIHRLLVPDRLCRAFDAVRHITGAGFAISLLNALDIKIGLENDDFERLPESGPVLAIANHPFGIVEGLVFAALLDRVRRDWKIVANSILAKVGGMHENLILVNPFGTRIAHLENLAPLRAAHSWRSRGGALVMFPAGEVASLNFLDQAISDPQWKTTAARLALKAGCPVVPVFFLGANSAPFQVAGAVHPVMRTLSLAREFDRLSGTTVRLRIGRPIPPGVLAACPNPQAVTAYMRSRTYLLANRSEPSPPHRSQHAPAMPITPPAATHLLEREVAELSPACCLGANSEFAVYLASPAAIPSMLEEIGRCREIAFRTAGEGTGEAADLDRFDGYYQHLFLWCKTDSRLAGAYRLAVTTDVLARFGTAGLYTSTLFRFHPDFFSRLGPAVELGRSFVLPEYQKNYASLLLLWKGIMRAVQRRPEAPILFGAVSISNQYRPASRSLMVNYLAARASHELARYVQPRKRFQHRAMKDRAIRRFVSLAADIEDISLGIADIEHDSKGVPVLLRQYLKAGGRLLGFNLDPSFSDVLDALIVADLRTAPAALLERCMGRVEAKAFLEYSAQPHRRSGLLSPQ